MLPVRHLLSMFALAGAASAQAPAPTKSPRPPLESMPVKAAPAPLAKVTATETGLPTRPTHQIPTQQGPTKGDLRAGGRVMTMPTQVVHDLAADGTLWAHGTNWKGHFWRDIPAAPVTSFLRAYRTHGASFRVVSPLIADFIDEMNKDGELTKWTIALIRGGEE